MKHKTTFIMGLILITQLVLLAGAASAQFWSGSRLLLHNFEVDLDNAEVTTLFAVTNTADEPVRVRAFVHSNWGIKVLETTFELRAHDVLTADLYRWLAEGKLPDRILGVDEVEHVKAALSGQRSPMDDLFYSKELDFHLGVGYVVFQIASGPAEKDVLIGDFFVLAPGDDSAQGQALLNVDLNGDCEKLCLRHGLRFLAGGFDAGTEIFVWTQGKGQPSDSAFFPINRQVHADVLVYDEDGHLIDTIALDLLPLATIQVGELGLPESFGWLDIRTDQPAFMAVRYGALGRFSVGLKTFCMRMPPDPEPCIRLEKHTNGVDADLPNGPSIPVGDPVTWTYEVRNCGPVTLTDVHVTDDVEGAIDCPETTLEPGESMTCTLRGTAQACTYRNLGTAVGTTADGASVRDDDPSHYFGAADLDASVDLEKETLGEDGIWYDADDPTGPQISEGGDVSWRYVVTNTGSVALLNVAVSDDDPAVTVSCPRATLGPGQSMTCTASGSAPSNVVGTFQYENVGTVTAEAAGNHCDSGVVEVTASDPSHYFVQPSPLRNCSLDIEKHTNDEDADTITGPEIPVGGAVTWKYFVTNTADPADPLSTAAENVTVVDDKEGTIGCPKNRLEPGEQMTCVKTSTAELGQYANVAEVTATNCGADSDPSHYIGVCEARPAIDLEKHTNGFDADTGSGPAIDPGDPVTWTYIVTNTGNVALVNVSVDDDQEGHVCDIAGLAPGASQTCTKTGTAIVGHYSNRATASAGSSASCGPRNVSDSDLSHYHNECTDQPAIDLEKHTNGHDADTGRGPEIAPGAAVTWTYVVTNTGNVTLANVSVDDDQEGHVCDVASLAPGASQTCTLTGTALSGDYANLGTVTATSDPTGSCPAQNVSDSDPSHYHNDTTGGEGCTPGYWRQSQHFDSWIGFSQDDLFSDVFGVGPDVTLLDAVWAGGGGYDALGRHAVAALLNTANSGVDYFYTQADVIALVQQAYASGDPEPIKNLLAAQNEQGCPLN